MGILIAAIALFVGYGTAWLASDEVRYLSRAGAEQMEILAGRRPLAEILADPATDSVTRGLVSLVREVRGYADSLGLDAGETYTTYTDVGRDTLLLVVSASPPDCLCPHTWKYPIVGRVPYKGFFDPAMARREEERLAGRGYDTWLRPAGAYSTLGWFNDPLLSTAMARDSMELAATVFHEVSHNTLYLKSATPFNESFAQYAGYQSAEAFFRARGDTVLARRAADRWSDELLLGAFYAELGQRLEGFYATQPAKAALDSGRAVLGQWSRTWLADSLGPRFRSYRVGPLAERPVNNARLIAARLYRTHLDWFEAWHQRHGGDVRVAVAQLAILVRGLEGDRVFARLEAALAGDAGSR
jgi:predicted aminopeptidase